MKLVVSAACLALLSATFAGPARAALIDIQFAGNSGVLPPSPPQTGAAVVGVAGDRWNYFASNTGSSQPLITSAGLASGVSMSYSADVAYVASAAYTQFTGTPYANLMLAYLADSGNGIQASFAGFSSGQVVEFYAYTQGDNNSAGRTVAIEANGAAAGFSTQTNTNTFVEGDNYQYFKSVADAAGVVSLDIRTIYAIGNGNDQANVNGFQIITSPVPEPGETFLLGSGLVTLLAVARRKKKTLSPADAPPPRLS